MRARPAGADVAGQQHAAHRLELVRLAVLLLPGSQPAVVATADALVQDAFLRYLRRGEARRDPGAGLAALRSLVVRSSRMAGRRAPADRADPLRGLSTAQREAVVLALWAGLGSRLAAAASVTTEGASRTALKGGLEAARATPEHLTEALHQRAATVTAVDLRSSWADVLATDERLTARRRRGWRGAAGVVAATAAVLTVATLVGARPQDIGPEPDPTTSTTSITATELLSSPALAPGERPRAEVPWGEVTAGWAVIAAAAPPTAVTTTLLLVSPAGTRYALGTAPDSIVVQDVSPDGRRLLLAVGSQASEWDLVAGTSRALGVSYGWKTMRYAGRADRGFLVIWTDPGSAVRLDHWNTTGRLMEEYPLTLPPTAGSPGTPGVVVDPTGRQAVVSTREGPVATIDLGNDAVGALPVPDGASGCSPLSFWSPAQVLLACSSGGGRLFLAPLDGSPSQPLGGSGLADAWPAPTQAAFVQRDDPCATGLGTLDAAGSVTPRAVPPPAEGLVPNAAAAGVLYLGGTRCPADGSRLVAYDLASGQATLLAGEDAGGRAVRQAVVLQARG